MEAGNLSFRKRPAQFSPGVMNASVFKVTSELCCFQFGVPQLVHQRAECLQFHHRLDWVNQAWAVSPAPTSGHTPISQGSPQLTG